MKKEIWFLIILSLIIIVLAGVLLWPKNKSDDNNLPQINGIQIDLPKANEEIFSPLKITGVTNGGGWNGFEGQVGTVRLLDSNGSQLGKITILSATTDWMSQRVSFEANLEFSSNTEQEGKLVFRNENASGLPEHAREFILPVKIAKTSGQLMTVRAYFNNSELDPEYSCDKVFPVERQVLKTEAVARASLDELLKGLTEAEEDAGFFTSINDGVKIQSLKIENNTAYVDFDEQLEYQVGGSCRVSAIRAQITETLKQFETVKNVIISIDGRTEDILQP